MLNTPKKKITARLSVVKTHTLTTGAAPNDIAIENMAQTGEWEGYVKLETPEGESLIMEVTDDLGGVLIGSVVKGTPSLLERLTTPKPEN